MLRRAQSLDAAAFLRQVKPNVVKIGFGEAA
jgi:hypothetical protein